MKRQKKQAGGNKYHARKIVRDGQTFDSIKEYRRWRILQDKVEAGTITELQRQVKFVLVPTQREPDRIGPRGGKKPGFVIEKELAYIADFTYKDETGALIVEDVKGYRNTKGGAYGTFVIKRKLMLYLHGVRIKEV